MQSTRCLPVVVLCTLAAAACSGPEAEDAAPGTMRMGVVGQDAMGNYYRLRDGVFDITGPETAMVSTETSATPLETLTVELAAGGYDVLLNDGWRLERWDPILDTTLDVEATLTSDNPATTLVTGDATSTVVFQFSVADAGPVTLGDGDLEIDIDVSVDGVPPDAVVCDALAQDCPAGEGCYPTDVGGEVVFVCAPALPGAVYQACDFVNECDPGLLCTAADINTNCGGVANCCVALCDVAVPACEAGESCAAIGAADADVGICITP